MPNCIPASLRSVAWIVLAGLLAGPLRSAAPAQTSVLDEAPQQKAQLVLGPNGRHTPKTKAARDAHLRLSGQRVIRDSRVLVQGANSAPCDLVVGEDGQLRFENCHVQIRGDVYLKDGGLLEFVNCHVELLLSYSREFNYWWEGGTLYTERTLLGGRAVGWSNYLCNFELFAGLWNAKATTVQYAAGIQLGEGRKGFAEQASLRGGRLVADELHQGHFADAIIMSGAGDATIRNSRYAIHLFVYGDSKIASTTTLDLETRRAIPRRVLGDASVHDATQRPPVDTNIPGLPYRLELENVHVPFWWVSVRDLSGAANAPTIRFRIENSRGLQFGIHLSNIRGRPRAVGPWGSYYNAPFPELPTSTAPGEHEIPPACGVQIGNVVLEAGTSPVRVDAWNFYLREASDFAVRGPLRLGEVHIVDGSFLVEGSSAYDAHVVANTIDLHRASKLTLKGCSIGRYGLDRNASPQVSLFGRAHLNVENCRYDGVAFRSKAEDHAGPYYGENAAKLTIRDSLPSGDNWFYPSGAAIFDAGRASEGQNSDLQNLSLDAGIRAGGAPKFFAMNGGRASASAVKSPHSKGAGSIRWTSDRPAAALWKDVTIAPGAWLQWSGFVRQNAGAGNMSASLRPRSASGGVSATIPLRLGKWRSFRTAPFRVPAGDTGAIFDVAFANAGALDVQVDDLELEIATWSDTDNLFNLDFEVGAARSRGIEPQFYRRPDFWLTYFGDAAPSNDVPSQSSGRYSIQISPRDGEAVLWKELYGLRPGTVVTMEARVKLVERALGPSNLKAHIGSGPRWWDRSIPGHKAWVRAGSNGAWVDVPKLSFTVSSSDSWTRFGLSGGVPGQHLLVDDVRVTVTYAEN